MARKRRKREINPVDKFILISLSVIVFILLISVFFRMTHLLHRNEETELYKKSFTIDVRNACGENGAAHFYSDLLSKAEFDVINTSNLAKMTKMSYIVYKEGLPRKKVELISSITGIDSLVIDSLGSYLFDVTIILGKDFREKSSLFIRRYSDIENRKQ